MWRSALATLLVMALAAQPACSAAPPPPDDEPPSYEEPVCGILEGLAFSLWEAVAGFAPPPADPGEVVIRGETVVAPDGKRLSGYSIRRRGPAADDALFVLPGNAMLAAGLSPALADFAARGYDVYTFDYRGYGASEGRSLLKPVEADQGAIVRFIAAKGYRRVFVYGISFGGLLAMGPTFPRDGAAALVVDSAPARLPWYAACPPRYDPLANVPTDASRILVLSGGQDDVVAEPDVAPLGRAVAARGGTYVSEPGFGHPLADGDDNTARRFAIVDRFFRAAR